MRRRHRVITGAALLMTAGLAFLAGRAGGPEAILRQPRDTRSPVEHLELPGSREVTSLRVALATLEEENEDLRRKVESMRPRSDAEILEDHRKHLIEQASASLPPGRRIEQVAAEVSVDTFQRLAASLDEAPYQALLAAYVRRQVSRTISLAEAELEQVVTIVRSEWDRVRAWQRDHYLGSVRSASSMSELNKLYGDRHRRIFEIPANVQYHAARTVFANKPDRNQLAERLFGIIH